MLSFHRRRRGKDDRQLYLVPDMTSFILLPILMCIADDTKWLFFRIFPPPAAGEKYTTKLGSILVYQRDDHIMRNKC